MKKQIQMMGSLFFYFFRISWFTFGGGWSMVVQMQKDYVENERIIDAEELLDIVSVGRSLPGTMIGNVAYLFGHHQAGVLGGLAALSGLILPPMLILSVLTFCYSQFQNNLYVVKMLNGVRAAVVPIILAAALKLSRTAISDRFGLILCIAACVLNACFHVNCVILIVCGLIIGLMARRWKEART